MKMQVRDIMGDLGENQAEGHLVLTASEILEFERLIELTPLGKAAIMNRAAELLTEVEDYFVHTPYCPACRKHKLELRVGEPIGVTCTGGCVLD